MSSQKQSHRLRKLEQALQKDENIKQRVLQHNDELLAENTRLKYELHLYKNRIIQHYMYKPSIWNIPAYIKWKKELKQCLEHSPM